jgi:hypothetical protein
MRPSQLPYWVQRDAIRLNGESEARPGHFFFSGPLKIRAQLAPNCCANICPTKRLLQFCAKPMRSAAIDFRLLGYDNLDFTPGAIKCGNGNFKAIDWHLDPVHGKRVPLDPWFKIPFLDFAKVGDHKVIWELNRHQHLVTLAKARLLTGDDKYIRELAAQWHSWIEANPYPLGINWGSTLEVAFRSFVVDMGGPVAGGNGRVCELAGTTSAGARVSRTLRRTLPVRLFFSQHTPAGGSAGPAFSRHVISGISQRGALERLGVEGCAARGGAAGSSGWRLLRAGSALPRLCARLLLVCAPASSAKWHGGSRCL